MFFFSFFTFFTLPRQTKELNSPKTRSMKNLRELATSVAEQTSIFFDKPVHVEEIFKPRTRYRENVVARTVFAHLLREKGMTFMNIGRVTNEDHSTLIHRIKKFDNAVHTDKIMYDQILSGIPKSLSGTITYNEYRESVNSLTDEVLSLIEKEDLSQLWVSTKCKQLLNKIKST